jgi:two-component system nitrate/nitrite response regulator NarL
MVDDPARPSEVALLSGGDARRLRVVIIAAVRLYREGLAAELARRGWDVVGAVGDIAPGSELVRQLRPEITLVDIGPPETIERLPELVNVVSATKILALGVPERPADVVACAEAGLDGYVPREASLDDLVERLQAADRGEVKCPEAIVGSLFSRIAALADEQRPSSVLHRLTGREREIVDLIERGLSNKQIALELGIELSTVKNHVHRIFEKLDVQRRTEAAALVRRI